METRTPPWMTRVTAPGAAAFAVLSGMEAMTRALIAASLPIQTQALFGNDESVSQLSLAGSVAALLMALLLPRLAVAIGRVRLCVAGIIIIGAASALFLFQVHSFQLFGFICRAVGAVVFYSMISMYIMDHVRRDQIGRAEPLRLLSIGLAWTAGPFIGVQIEEWWGEWAPFLASIGFSTLLLGCFLILRFGEAPIIQAANASAGAGAGTGATAKPGRKPGSRLFSWSQIRSFVRQPRLVLAWCHAFGRGFFWNALNLYAPLFAIHAGLGAKVGGLIISIGSAFMLAMPLWGWLSRRYGIRRVSLICFPVACFGMAAAGVLDSAPWLAAVALVLSALAMSVIDGYGNALYLRACKPSQRTTMTPIFSTHRDLTDIGQSALFAVLLLFLPVTVVFISAAVVMGLMVLLSLRINRRL